MDVNTTTSPVPNSASNANALYLPTYCPLPTFSGPERARNVPTKFSSEFSTTWNTGAPSLFTHSKGLLLFRTVMCTVDSNYPRASSDLYNMPAFSLCNIRRISCGPVSVPVSLALPCPFTICSRNRLAFPSLIGLGNVTSLSGVDFQYLTCLMTSMMCSMLNCIPSSLPWPFLEYYLWFSLVYHNTCHPFPQLHLTAFWGEYSSDQCEG